MLVVDKNYPGLTRSGNGNYVLGGNLTNKDGIEIQLDAPLEVADNIETRGKLIAWDSISAWRIEAGLGVAVDGDIEAGAEIVSVCGVEARGNIKSATDIITEVCLEAGGSIEAGWTITAGASVYAGESLKVGYGIRAGNDIEAGTTIEAGGRIFAGTNPYLSEKQCPGVIRCRELVSGQICHGTLEIVPNEEGGKA